VRQTPEKASLHKITETRKLSAVIRQPLRAPLAGIWEIYFERRWRVLFEIDENNKSIIIVGFKHRDEMT
jgi:mRNA-degrading endonuclease RelE of RelBE toxin-antitoxin system